MGKRKRSKRLFPVRYSAGYVSAPRIDANKAAAYNAMRSKATYGARSDSLHKPDNSFMQEVPQTPRLSTHEPQLVDGNTGERYTKSHPPKKSSFLNYKTPPKLASELKHEYMVIEEKRKEGCLLMFYKVWQGSNRLQGVHEYHCQLLRDKNNTTLKLFFAGMEALFVLEDEEERFVSETYYGLANAQLHYKNNNIKWKLREKTSRST